MCWMTPFARFCLKHFFVFCFCFFFFLAVHSAGGRSWAENGTHTTAVTMKILNQYPTRDLLYVAFLLQLHNLSKVLWQHSARH